MPVRNHHDLIAALIARREALGLSQLDVDFRAGWAGGYTGKLEVGPEKHGGRAFWSERTLPRWLDALECKIELVGGRVPFDDARALTFALAPNDGGAG